MESFLFGSALNASQSSEPNSTHFDKFIKYDKRVTNSTTSTLHIDETVTYDIIDPEEPVVIFGTIYAYMKYSGQTTAEFIIENELFDSTHRWEKSASATLGRSQVSIERNGNSFHMFGKINGEAGRRFLIWIFYSL